MVEVQKRKLHFILTRLPYPPVGGDRLKSYNLIKILSRHFNLHIVIITDEKDSDENTEFLTKYSAHFQIFHFPKWRFLFNASFAFLGNEPLQSKYYQFSKVERYLKKHIDQDDLLICCLIRTAAYSFKYPNVKLLDIVDSISINYNRSIEKVESFFWKLIYRFEMPRVEAYEKKCLQKFDSTFFVNSFEAEHWSKFGNVAWVPNGVNPDILNYHFFPDNKYKKVITFFGKMDYQPNVDAVKWFIERCLPYVDKAYSFLIVGSNPCKIITRLAAKHDRVSYTGFVTDPYFILASSAMVIAPMQTGGGIQNKILESMALGCIVVTTSLGGNPIKGAINGEHLLIEDDPYKMAQVINEVLTDPGSFDYMGKNAKAFIRQNFTWDIYETRLLSLISSLGVKVATEAMSYKLQDSEQS